MPVSLSGSLLITGSITTSGTITAQTLVVQTITSSIVNLTGSNIFGSQLTDTQTFTGSVVMTGSLTVNTTGTEFQVTNAGVVMGNLLADNHSVTGSLRVTGSISGSLFGTSSQAVSSSYALTASFALTAGGASGFPFTGSASITGSFRVSGSTNISASAYALQLLGSGSSVFSVDGTVGRLFEVDDSLSGSLFSVNTAAGLPIIEAFSDNTVRIGQYGQKALFVSQSRVGIGTETPVTNLDVSGSVRITNGLSETGSVNISGSITMTGSFTTSGTITAQTLVVQVITSSIDFVTGSTRFGSLLTNTHTFTGSLQVTGSGPHHVFGNVGIGTASPSSILQISASSSTITGKVILQSPSSDSGILQIGSSYGEASMMFIPGVTAFGTSSPARTSSYGNAALWGVGAGTYTSDPTKFGIANVGYGANVLTVSSSCALGIGTNNPTTRLFVLGSGTYGTPTTEILTSDATIFSSEMSNDAYNSILQLVSVRQSLSTGANSNGFLGFSTIDDSNGEGIRDAGRVAIVNETAAARNSATALSFWTNPGGTKTTAAAEKLRLTSGGYLRLASSGIQFNGDTAAANALNDYEEGTWTPVLAGSTVAGTVGYAYRSASYVKIGNYVFVRWGFQINSISSATGTVRITGLPFTSVSWGSYQEPSTSVSTGNLATAATSYRARMFVGGASTLLEGRVMDNGDTPWSISDFGGDEWIIGELFYNIA